MSYIFLGNVQLFLGNVQLFLDQCPTFFGKCPTFFCVHCTSFNKIFIEKIKGLEISSK